MEYKFKHLDKIHTVNLEMSSDRCKVIIDGESTYTLSRYSAQYNRISFEMDNRNVNVTWASDKDNIYLAVNGEYFIFETGKSRKQQVKATANEKGDSVASPMPGLLVKMPVKVGDRIISGTTLAIVEAMKMQNELRSPRDGVVKKVNFKEGDQVDAFVPIVELEAQSNAIASVPPNQ